MLKHIVFHKSLVDSGRWFELNIYDQLANIGAEVGRSINNEIANDKEKYDQSILRMFELFDMSMSDPRWRKTGRMREICRLRELVTDYFYGENIYKTSKEYFDKYFFILSVVANDVRRKKRLEKG